jgi:hypothetical protein
MPKFLHQLTISKSLKGVINVGTLQQKKIQILSFFWNNLNCCSLVYKLKTTINQSKTYLPHLRVSLKIYNTDQHSINQKHTFLILGSFSKFTLLINNQSINQSKKYLPHLRVFLMISIIIILINNQSI